MKILSVVNIAMICSVVAAAEILDSLPTAQTTTLQKGTGEGDRQADTPTPSIRKSFTLADLKETAMIDPLKTDDSVATTLIVPSMDARHGLAAALDVVPPPTTSHLRVQPMNDDGNRAIHIVSDGFPTPVLVQQTPEEHHHHHPWGPPPHFGPPPFGSSPIAPVYWGPQLQFCSSLCGPSRWGDPRWLPVSEPRWSPQQQSQHQWPPAQASEPSAPSPTPQGREAFRVHVGVKGNNLDGFLQALIKAMSGMKSDTVVVPSGAPSEDALKPEPTPQQLQEHDPTDQLPIEDAFPAVADDAANPPVTTAPDPFAFSYAAPPVVTARTVRVTAPPYDVADADLTSENLDEVKYDTHEKPESTGP